MKKYRIDDHTLDLIEASPIPFAVYQFVSRRVVTLALSAGFCRLFGYEDRARAYHDMDEQMYVDTHPDDVSRISEAAVFHSIWSCGSSSSSARSFSNALCASVPGGSSTR